MTKEQEEAIDRLNRFKTIEVLYSNTFTMHIEQLKTVQEDIETVLNMLKEKDKKIEKVLELIFQYGQIDGEHHKTWVIDQIVRILTKDKYNEWIKNYVYDEETGDIYSWDKGIAP